MKRTIHTLFLLVISCFHAAAQDFPKVELGIESMAVSIRLYESYPVSGFTPGFSTRTGFLLRYGNENLKFGLAAHRNSWRASFRQESADGQALQDGPWGVDGFDAGANLGVRLWQASPKLSVWASAGLFATFRDKVMTTQNGLSSRSASPNAWIGQMELSGQYALGDRWTASAGLVYCRQSSFAQPLQGNFQGWGGSLKIFFRPW